MKFRVTKLKGLFRRFLLPSLLSLCAIVSACRPNPARNTIYAAGFDEAKFLSIKVGDTGIEAIEKAGLPLKALRSATHSKDSLAMGNVEVIPSLGLKEVLRDPGKTNGFWITLQYSATPSGEVRNYIRRNVLASDGIVIQVAAVEYVE